MTREIRQMSEIAKEQIRTESVKTGSSVFTMAAVAGCLLLCVGIVIYALIGA